MEPLSRRKDIVLESIFLVSLVVLAHTWGGELNLEECYKTLKVVDRNMQDIKKKFHISRIIAGMNAQVEVNHTRNRLLVEAQGCTVEILQNIAKSRGMDRET